MANRHSRKRGSRSDQKKGERLQIELIEKGAFPRAIARIDGKHEHHAQANGYKPLALSPKIVFPNQK